MKLLRSFAIVQILSKICFIFPFALSVFRSFLAQKNVSKGKKHFSSSNKYLLFKNPSIHPYGALRANGLVLLCIFAFAHIQAHYDYIAFLKDVTLSDIARVGGKNASLGQMISALNSQGIRVPHGFAITSFGNNITIAINSEYEKCIFIHAPFFCRKIIFIEF